MNALSFDMTVSSSHSHHEPILDGNLRQPFGELLTSGEVRKVKAGAMAVVEGQQDTDLFIMMEGQAEVMAQLQQPQLSAQRKTFRR